MSLPYFPMYPTDFEADTSHLTLEEDGAYNRLLRLMW
ncbi:MAG: YdaU family protein, partial [Chloroflexi bacterium]|nr:YdaU family protein [Chloroflexota bacterium]